MKIQECPSWEEVTKAVEVLNKQFLHVYQLLFSEGLTNPYHYAKLKVGRKFVSNTTTVLIEVYVPDRENGLHFSTRVTDESDEEILRKARMLVDGRGMKKLPHACCPYAERISCVCLASFSCQIHGETHVGTHD